MRAPEGNVNQDKSLRPLGKARYTGLCPPKTSSLCRTRTWATLGNHDYDSGYAWPAFDYFGDRAGPRGLGYYSLDLFVDWHGGIWDAFVGVVNSIAGLF